MQDKPKLFKSNKVILMIGLVFVIFIITSSIIVFHVNVNNRQLFTELKAEADDLKARAVKAQKNNNNAAAIELLEEAKEKYEQAGDTNNVIDAESLLFISKQAK